MVRVELLDGSGHRDRPIWNRTINLTALPLDDFPTRSLEKLIVEPLIVARELDEKPAVWFDLGSGGVSPAVTIKVVKPLLRLTMVESKARKSAFLREVVRELKLGETEVLTERFEELARAAALKGTVELVTARAVKPDQAFLAAITSLLGDHGVVALFGWMSEQDLDAAGLKVLSTTPLPGDGNFVRWLSRR